MTPHARLVGLLAALLALGVVAPVMGSSGIPSPDPGEDPVAQVAVEPVDDPVIPAAVCALKAYSDYALIDVINPVAIDVLANDCLGDARPDRPLTVTAVTQGTYGTVTSDGRSLIYNPNGCTLGDGGWDTFGYTVSDGTGTSSSIVGVQFRRPATSPVTDLPQAGFVAGSTMGSTVPVRLSWCGVAASGASVRSYRVIQSTNGGSTYPTTVTAATASTASTRGLAVNTSYRWRVRTTDSKGRTGGYVPSLTSRVARYQENNAVIRYSTGWRSTSSSRYSGGKERYVQRSGATATTTVTNVRQFAIVASKAPKRGSFHVYVDGVRRATISQRSGAPSYRRVLYVGGLTSGAGVTHTIQVRSATSARIDLDAILTLSGKQDQAVTFTSTAPAGAAYLGMAAAPAASGSSGLPVTLSLPQASWAVCSLDGPTVSFHGVGACTVTATAASDQTWNARAATQSFAVGPAPVTVTGITARDRPYAPGVTTAILDTTNGVLVGVDPADTAGVALDTSSATGTFADPNAGPGKVVQVAGLALTGVKAGLYAVTQPTTTASITKANQVITFTTGEPAAVKGGSAYTVAATASSGLPVTVTVAAGSAGVCSISGSTVSFPGSGTCDLEADQAGDGNWNAAPTAVQSFSVASTGTQPQAITFDALTNRTYGDAPVALTATSTSGLPVALTSLTPGVCPVSGATAVLRAAGTCTVKAGQPGDSVYAPAADVSRSFTVAQKPLTATGITTANKVYDGLTTAALNTTQAVLQGVGGADDVTLVKTGATGTFTPDANAGVGKTVTVSGLSLSGAKAGSYTLVQPTTTASITKATLIVTPASQAIVYGSADPVFGFGYTGFVNGESSAVIDTAPTCGVAGSSRDVAGSPYSISCSGGSANNYQFNLAATAALTVTPKPLTASFTAANRAYTGTTAATITGCSLATIETADLGAATCSFAGATATFATKNVGTAIAVTGTGFTIAGAKAGNYAITAVNPTAATISRAAAACTVTPYAVTYDGSAHTATGQCLGVQGEALDDLDLSATTHTDAGSYPSDPWTFTDVTGNYTNASGTVADSIAKAPQVVTFTSTPPSSAYVGDTYAVNAAGGGSANPVTLSIAVADPVACSIDGSVVTFLAAGTCTIAANQAGDANHLPGSSSQQVAVSLVPQVINFPAIPARTYGDAPFGISASGGDSGNPVTFTTQTPSVCSVTGGTVTILSAGLCTIRASQAGNGTYAAATPVDQTFAIARANQTISFTSTPPSPAVAGGPTYTVTATGGASGNSLVFTAGPPSRCTVAGSVVTFTSTGNCTVRANQAGNTNYTDAPEATQSISITLTAQAITFNPLPDKTYGDAPFTVSATSTSGLTVSFGSQTTAVCTSTGTNGSTVTLVAAGTCTIRASQAGNSSYAAAGAVDRSFSVATRAITVTAVTGTKVADGTTGSTGVPTITAGTLANGDTGTWTQTYDTAAAGTGKTLTPSGTVAHGATNLTASYAITFVPVSTGSITPAAASTLAVAAGAAQAAGTPFSVTVTARDPYGNTATGYTGTVTLTSTDPGATLGPGHPFTVGDAGVHVFTGVTLVTAGSQTVTATGTGPITGQVAVTVSPGPLALVAINPSSASIVAGGSQAYTAQGFDAYGNGLGNVTATTTFAIVPDGDCTGATCAATHAGPHTVTGTNGVLTDSASLTVTPGPAATLEVTTTSPQAVGVEFTVTVVARDAHGNPATGYTGTVALTSDALDTMPAPHAFTEGDASMFAFGVTIGGAGTWTFTATDTVSATVTGASGPVLVE